MNIETIIFIYIYICVCVSVFDLLFAIYTRYTKKAIPRIMDELQILLQPNSDPAHLKRLYLKLCSLNTLIAYSELLTNAEDKKLVDSWALRNANTLQKLTAFYCRKSPEKQAFWAYLLSCTDLRKISDQDEESALCVSKISTQMIQLITAPSVYVRENAFKAVMRTRSWKHVIEVLLTLNDHSTQLDEKLVVDNLLAFAGDHQLLASEIWKHFSELDNLLQLSYINYMRMLRSTNVPHQEYCEGFFHLLETQNTDKEVRLALLRYFRTHHYPPVYPLLIDFASSTNELMWRYAAVSATTLAAYPGEQTITVLQAALSSRNWYQRLNAAESLLALGAGSELVDDCNDPYAQEMMLHRKQLWRQKKEAIKQNG